MFTLDAIREAQAKMKSGADFPKYIQWIKELGVIAFETWVTDSHTEYFGADDFRLQSDPLYPALSIADQVDGDAFQHYLKIHQQGKTDYLGFCRHCAETGVEKWVVLIPEMTCTYLDKEGNSVLVEQIPDEEGLL
jgi:uncharacterized protein YbcV (DUF1398 family)